MKRILILLLCLCNFLVALDYQTLSNSKIYQQWLIDVQNNRQIGVCNNPESSKCKETIKESCNTLPDDEKEKCKNQIIFNNTSTYNNYVILANDTPMAIRAMIENDDISGLKAIIKAMPEIVGQDIITLEGDQVGNFVEYIVCYSFLYPKSLEILLEDGKLNPNFMIDNNNDDYPRTCNDLSLLQYATQKLQEAKEIKDTQAIQDYQKIVELLKKYGAK